MADVLEAVMVGLLFVLALVIVRGTIFKGRGKGE